MSEQEDVTRIGAPLPRICVECVWYRAGRTFFSNAPLHGCTHPRAVSIITGEAVDARDERSYGSKEGCGPEGKRWVQR